MPGPIPRDPGPPRAWQTRAVRFRAPANVLLRRAQLTLMLATLVPTVLMTALGIVLLAVGSASVNLNLVAGVLLVAFCTTSLTGYILGSIFVSRGASLARVQNDFLSSVSHELRTPLTSIRMFIEMLRDDRLTDSAEKAKCLDLLHQEVQRLDGLVSRVLELSRIESGRHGFEHGPVALDLVVSDALAAFEAATVPHFVAVSVEAERGLWVNGDRATLALALTNLLVNAWKYTGAENRQIQLKLAACGEREVELVVADNGVGIPRQEQRRIFEHFERGRAAVDNRSQGSGLGLAIVRAVIQAHRGKVEVRSKEGRGSQFRIKLRRRPAATA